MDSPSDNSFYEDHIEETNQPAVKDSASGEADENAPEPARPGTALSTVDENTPATTETKTLMPDQESAVDDELVDEAYAKVEAIVVEKMSSVMEEVGDYLLDAFFDGDTHRAWSKKPSKDKSFNQLITRLRGKPIMVKLRETHVRPPSKSWLYNAVNMAADKKYFEQIGFSEYNKLGPTHRVYLTHVNDVETKKVLIKKAVDEGHSSRYLKGCIDQTKTRRRRLNLENIEDADSREMLKAMNPKKLKKMEKQLESKIKDMSEEFKKTKEKFRKKAQAYHSSKHTIEKIIKEKEKEQRKSKKS